MLTKELLNNSTSTSKCIHGKDLEMIKEIPLKERLSERQFLHSAKRTAKKQRQKLVMK